MFPQIRRKADPAKGLVKDWVSKWRDDRTVRGSVSHDQISGIKCQHRAITHNSMCLLRTEASLMLQLCYHSWAASTRRMEHVPE